MGEAKDWTPKRLLEAWGARQSGALRSPIKLSTGGNASTDDEWQAMHYVESTEGFGSASLVLRHVYSRLLPISTYRPAQPGESFTAELLFRRGWGFALGCPQPVVGGKVLERFKEQLADRVRTQPFTPVREVEDDESRERAEARAGKQAETL